MTQSSRVTGVVSEPLGTVDGMDVDLFTLRNRHGAEVRATNYGAIVVSVRVRDRDDVFDDVVLGFESLADYRAHGWYCGGIVGRNAGRIRDARFTLDGHRTLLTANHGVNHLHGGNRGFDRVVWKAEPIESAQGLRLRYVSRDGEEGYRGMVAAEVTYTLTEDDALVIDFLATTDQPTPINLTQHSYFNLAGCHGDVLGHELMINADAYLVLDSGLIPTGEYASVAATPFDFRQPAAIGARIDADHEQLRLAHGYDHDFVVRTDGRAMPLAARVQEPATGRVLEVFTTQPALHFYSGSFIGTTPLGKEGVAYGGRSGFALEAQHFPDSPNQPAFPSTILRPGAAYRARTVYRFSVAGEP